MKKNTLQLLIKLTMPFLTSSTFAFRPPVAMPAPRVIQPTPRIITPPQVNPNTPSTPPAVYLPPLIGGNIPVTIGPVNGANAGGSGLPSVISPLPFPGVGEGSLKPKVRPTSGGGIASPSPYPIRTTGPLASECAPGDRCLNGNEEILAQGEPEYFSNDCSTQENEASSEYGQCYNLAAHTDSCDMIVKCAYRYKYKVRTCVDVGENTWKWSVNEEVIEQNSLAVAPLTNRMNAAQAHDGRCAALPYLGCSCLFNAGIISRFNEGKYSFCEFETPKHLNTLLPLRVCPTP